MKYPSNFKLITGLNWLLVAGCALTILLFRSSLPNKIPLFYSLPWGNNQLAPREWFFLVPLLVAVIGLVNQALAHLALKKNEVFLASLLISFGLICTLLGIITTFQIIRIII